MFYFTVQYRVIRAVQVGWPYLEAEPVAGVVFLPYAELENQNANF